MPARKYTDQSGSNNNCYRHGHATKDTQSKTYRVWSAMVTRCTNPNSPKWPRYGGRGISVCHRWRTFANFLADMGEKPDGTSIDRIDNDSGYFKENCRWTTRKVQQNNMHSNRRVALNGKTQTLSQWADEIGISKTALYKRLAQRWPLEVALTKPGRRSN